MIFSHPYKVNSDFQNTYFILNSIQNPDAKWGLLWSHLKMQKDSKEDLEITLLKKEGELEKLQSQDITDKTHLASIKLLQKEIRHIQESLPYRDATIRKLENELSSLNEQCVFSHLPFDERFEKSLELAWREELEVKVKLSLFGHALGVDPSQFEVFLLHPDRRAMLSSLEKTINKIRSYNSAMPTSSLSTLLLSVYEKSETLTQDVKKLPEDGNK